MREKVAMEAGERVIAGLWGPVHVKDWKQVRLFGWRFRNPEFHKHEQAQTRDRKAAT
jgi:hypothetical protein